MFDDDKNSINSERSNINLHGPIYELIFLDV